VSEKLNTGAVCCKLRSCLYFPLMHLTAVTVYTITLHHIRITHTSLVIAWLLTIVLALIGYLSFVDKTRADILNNFSANGKAASAARALLAVAMLLTYPMEMMVARHACYVSAVRACKGSEVSYVLL
jgi:Transmembrane amino acid transporter protein